MKTLNEWKNRKLHELSFDDDGEELGNPLSRGDGKPTGEFRAPWWRQMFGARGTVESGLKTKVANLVRQIKKYPEYRDASPQKMLTDILNAAASALDPKLGMTFSAQDVVKSLSSPTAEMVDFNTWRQKRF